MLVLIWLTCVDISWALLKTGDLLHSFFKKLSFMCLTSEPPVRLTSRIQSLSSSRGRSPWPILSSESWTVSSLRMFLLHPIARMSSCIPQFAAFTGKTISIVYRIFSPASCWTVTSGMFRLCTKCETISRIFIPWLPITISCVPSSHHRRSYSQHNSGTCSATTISSSQIRAYPSSRPLWTWWTIDTRYMGYLNARIDFYIAFEYLVGHFSEQNNDCDSQNRAICPCRLPKLRSTTLQTWTSTVIQFMHA
jgi:hypothetical protein